ncbi:MAG: alkyl hydroperoxide reductase/Thiol specific antioxidant/Mal allergen [Frankiales bacterium]|nr:alkyl hydroperoxide reductase/Thiol specific antioxidant/Mal allergen [Frankiales bacterium]
MNRSRWTVLVLVVLALGMSVVYGLRDKGADTNAADLRPLQEAARLDPCPAGLGPAFPKLTLSCLGGGPKVALQSAVTGRPTLVNVYGSWCGPCQVEMPILRELYDKSKDKLALVGIDTQEQVPGYGLRFAISVRQHWPALLDDERVVGAHFSPGVPLMLFVDPAGKVVHVEHTSGYKDLSTLEQDVRTYLGVTV